MASLMGMNRFMGSEGMKGLGVAANLQTQRENAKTQLEAGQDATTKSTVSNMAGAGGMMGYMAGPSIPGMVTPAVTTPLESAAGMSAMQSAAGTVAATPGLVAGQTAGAVMAPAVAAETGAATAGGTTAAAVGAGEAAATAGSGAAAGAEGGSAAGPWGALAGAAIGALAGWLMSEFG